MAFDLFIEVVRRWEAGMAAGGGTKDLKRRHGSLAEVRNTELDEECDNLSNRQDEQSLTFAEWELSTERASRAADEAPRAAGKERWLAESRDQGVRSHDQEVRYLELWKKSYGVHVEFAQVHKEHQRADAAHIATLEMALGIFACKAGVLKADPVAKKQKTEPRNAKGGWGGSRRGAAFEAKNASSGTAEQKGGEGAASERIPVISNSGRLDNPTGR
jgi:hypothetical protein